jgi:hypothetical protein
MKNFNHLHGVRGTIFKIQVQTFISVMRKIDIDGQKCERTKFKKWEEQTKG